MNQRLIVKTLGSLLLIESICMLPSLLVALFYHESATVRTFVICMALTAGVALVMRLPRLTSEQLYARDGIAIVGIGWILLSIFGALPYYVSGSMTSFVDALFETASGFTTTGATILSAVEVLPRGILFWRGFTNWMGGMGVLVLLLAVLPAKANTLHIMQAESPGPSVSKFTSRIGEMAKILYQIYLLLSVILLILLLLAGMPLFDSLIHTFAAMSTGGFSSRNTSVGTFQNPAAEIILTIFMLLASLNFTLFYMIGIGKTKEAVRDEEMRFYLTLVTIATLLITADIWKTNIPNIWDALRHAAFQVSTIVTTTGFSSVNFDLWPMFSKYILLLLMFLGGCAGSTSGGIKAVRFLVLFKVARQEIGKMLHPRSVRAVKVDGKPVEDSIIKGMLIFFALYLFIFFAALLIVCLDGKDFLTSFSAVAATLSNIGPGLGEAGPMGHFGDFSILSKLVFFFCMLIGRLEIYPILALFSPTFWKRSNRGKNKSSIPS
jgi:Trk-type K+ transport systems, membrane components